MQSPTVLLGKPDNADRYDLYNIDDINVYVRKDIQARKNELRILLRKFLWVKELDVEGMRLNF